MSAITTDERAADALTEVVDRRLRQLFQAGFDAQDAAAVAARLDVDLHEALDLLARGCPSGTALRILC
jgi:hypothetical protein